MKRVALMLLIACVFGSCTSSSAQMTSRVVRDSLFIPWEMVWSPDNTIWFTQKNGYICRLEPVSGMIDTIYHEPETVIQSEGGMMGLALHPDFPAEPYVYVGYNYNQGGYREKIVRYTYANNTLQSPQVLIDNIAASSIHNGCRLLIVGDKLFITTGDAANQSLPQDVSSLNGKVLRINLDGSIPADNPIPGSAVWSWGHRNAQGLIYANNILYSSEHGPATDDELNIIEKGRNYGWPEVRGYCNTSSEITFCNDSNVVEPLMAWTPTIAVGGIDWYDHGMFPALQQSILMVTLKDQTLYQLKLNSTFDSVVSATEVSGISFGRLRDILVAPNGRIYISTSNSSAGGTGSMVDKIIELFDPNFTNVQQVGRTGDLAIYPNPAGAFTVVTVPVSLSALPTEYTVYEASGSVVMKGMLSSHSEIIETGVLAAGAYQVVVRGKDGGVYRGRIMKH